ncbi:MAG: aminotransferase class I/II-fold pyridoxal phosphate-dependent enzyme [Nitrososphaeria archaeon]|nr:aminotransferase class I/II-fold pyridoxal phosphate-dependent enzyme [Nitrososphaeria archaeon]
MIDELMQLREEVRKVTEEILRMIAKRRELILKIADIKKRLNLNVVDRSTERFLLSESLKLSEELGLDKDLTKRLVSLLILDSVKIQEQEIGKTQEIGLREIFYTALELQRSGKKIIRLEVGEPDFTAPQEVIDEACRSLREGRAKYLSPYGLYELREAVAQKMNDLFKLDLKPENVLITCGGIMAIRIAIEVLSNLGDEILVPEPAWPLYKQIAEQLSRRYIGLRTEMVNDWTLKNEEIRKSVTATSRVLIINYPNNPTGRALDLSELKRLVEEARDLGLTIISDEVYSGYYYHGERAPSIAQVLDEGYVLVNSFSKMWGMTGYRIGYIIGSKEFIEKAATLLSLMITCVPEFIQRAALKAIEDDEYVKKNVIETKKRIDYMLEKLSKCDLVEVRKPDGTFYLFPKIKIPNFNSSEFALKLLKEHNVAVAPGSGFGNYPQHIRLSAVKPIREIDEGIEKLLQAINQLSS